jgi:hypothetical protein
MFLKEFQSSLRGLSGLFNLCYPPKRRESDAEVVERTAHAQPPLIGSLNVSPICPLLDKGGEFLKFELVNSIMN